MIKPPALSPLPLFPSPSSSLKLPATPTRAVYKVIAGGVRILYLPEIFNATFYVARWPYNGRWKGFVLAAVLVPFGIDIDIYFSSHQSDMMAPDTVSHCLARVRDLDHLLLSFLIQNNLENIQHGQLQSIAAARSSF